MMNLEPTVRREPHEEVIVDIMELIEKGAFLPGELLPEMSVVVETLKHPEPEITRAIEVLRSENILLDKGGGLILTHSDKDLILSKLRNRVLNIHSADIVDLLEIREGLETRAFVLATERATKEDLTRIESALVTLEEAVQSNNSAAKEDLEFHLALVKASHNPTLVRVVEIIFEQFYESLNETRTNVRKLDRADHFIEAHRQLYDALVAKEADRGVELMKTHIEDTIALYKSIRK